MDEVVITAALRSAVGKFDGSIAKVAAADLGAQLIKALLARSGGQAEQISEVILGQVLTAGVGQNPARQALIRAGLPDRIPGMTIGEVCGRGLKATHLAAQAIKCGDADIVIAGGQENMSASPHDSSAPALRPKHSVNSNPPSARTARSPRATPRASMMALPR